MKKNVLKSGMAMIVAVLLVTVLSGYMVVCPEGPIPQCPFPDPNYSVFFPHPNDCHWYFHCSNGVAYCRPCPDGLHWNTELDVCDWPFRSGCIHDDQGNIIRF